MDFDRLIKHSTVSTEKHTVGLGIYFLDEMKGETPVTTQAIRDVVADARVDVDSRNLSAYPSQLVDDGYVIRMGDGYALSHDGQEYYPELFDLPEYPEERREDDFLKMNYSEERFYKQLIEDINRTYQVKVYDATLVLTRKLFESLLIDILRGHYGNQEIRLFFNPDTAQYLPFSVLIDNFDEQKQDFQHYSLSLDDDFIDELNKFRHDANESAHSIEVDVSEEEIEEKSKEATRIAEILFNVWRKIQVANGVGDKNKD